MSSKWADTPTINSRKFGTWAEGYTRIVVLVAAAVLFAAIAWMESADNTYRSMGVIAWLLSVACWIGAWWDGAPPRIVPKLRDGAGQFLVLAALVLLVAGVFRFYQIGSLPPEMTSDHAEKLLDVRDVLNGRHRIFFPRNTGREPAQFYATALLAGPLGFGLSYMALKFGTALIGWLTVPLTIWAARWGAGTSRRTALFAGLLLAISKWHVEIARVGLRFPYTPIAAALVLGFLFRALRFGRRRDWVLAGVAFGFGLHGYTATRILPLLFGVVFLFWWVLARHTWDSWRTALLNVALTPLSTIIAFVPLLRFSLENPDLFWFRSASRVAEGTVEPGINVFLQNVWNAALMFHVRGDSVWVNAVLKDPFLDQVTGILFVLGILYVLWRFLRRPNAIDATLIVAVPILLLPSILALAWPNENPSAVRTGGALPVVMLLSALPLDAVLRWSERRQSAWYRRITAFGLGLALILAALLNWNTYYVTYAKQYARFSWNSSEMAAEIQRLSPAVGGPEHVYIFSFPYWVDTRNVAFNMGRPAWDSVLFDIKNVTTEVPEPRAIIFNPDDVANLAQIGVIWPENCRRTVESRTPGKEFVVVTQAAYCDALQVSSNVSQ